MDYGGGASYNRNNAIEIVPNASGPENWMPASNDHAIWATEDDYSSWNGESSSENPSNHAYSDWQSQSRAPSEQPVNKKPRNSEGNGSTIKTSRAIGKMFYKTKLCCKFRAATCPYITNCNFAHGMEELRKPPPNWQEILAAHEEASEPREEHQIPILTNSSGGGGDGQRSYKGRHCKKFYTEEGCPYGDKCTFLHDDQSKTRECVAISLSPTVGSGVHGDGQIQKPSNWKTRICNKWEMTGYCPFDSKCHFAHGAAELHKYGGGLADKEGKDASSAATDFKQPGVPAKASGDAVVASVASVSYADVYHMGISSQRSSVVSQRQVLGQGQRPLHKWRGPDKISRIYGDWIEEDE